MPRLYGLEAHCSAAASKAAASKAAASKAAATATTPMYERSTLDSQACCEGTARREGRAYMDWRCTAHQQIRTGPRGCRFAEYPESKYPRSTPHIPLVELFFTFLLFYLFESPAPARLAGRDLGRDLGILDFGYCGAESRIRAGPSNIQYPRLWGDSGRWGRIQYPRRAVQHPVSTPLGGFWMLGQNPESRKAVSISAYATSPHASHWLLSL